MSVFDTGCSSEAERSVWDREAGIAKLPTPIWVSDVDLVRSFVESPALGSWEAPIRS